MQPVQEAYSTKNLLKCRLVQKQRFMQWQTRPPRSMWNVRSFYPILRPNPPPGVWLMLSALRISWSYRYQDSVRLSRWGSSRNCPSTRSSLKFGRRQLAFRSSRKPLNRMKYLPDIEWCILCAFYRGQFGEWVLATISPSIFLNGYISAIWKRHIHQQIKSVTLDRCSNTISSVPVLTIWRRHCLI